jgi:hypothetical protein
MHLIANLADPALARQPAILIRPVEAIHLRPLADRLGCHCLPANPRLVATILVAWILGGGRIHVWVPHLSPLDFPASLRAVLLQMGADGALRYFDDGLGCVSRESSVYRNGWVPRQATLHSWDYWSEPASASFPVTVNRSSFARALELVQSRAPGLCWQGIPLLESQGLLGAPRGTQSWPVALALASSHLDPVRVFERLAAPAQGSPAFYLPHYNAAKNDPTLMKLPVLRFDVPEFGLLGLAQHRPFSLLFGVTSTVLVLLELLFRAPVTYPVTFVCCASGCGEAAAPDERLSFLRLLAHYRDLPLFSAKGLAMVL